MSQSLTRLSFPPEASKKFGALPLVSWYDGPATVRVKLYTEC